MPVIQIDLQVMIALAGMVTGCTFLFGRALLSMYDKKLVERHTALTTALNDQGGRLTEIEKDCLKWQKETAMNYVRRDDYVRGQSVIEARLDAIAQTLTKVQVEGAKHGR